MGRHCPVCGKGMFKAKALKRHIRRYHPDYYNRFIKTGGFSYTQWCSSSDDQIRNSIICKKLRGEA